LAEIKLEDYFEAKEIKDKEIKKEDITTLEKTDEKCPQCGKELVVKLGKFGKFLSCTGFPDCKNTKPLNDEGTGPAEPETTDEKCPNCGSLLVEKWTQKRKRYIICSNNECRYTPHAKAQEAQQEEKK